MFFRSQLHFFANHLHFFAYFLHGFRIYFHLGAKLFHFMTLLFHQFALDLHLLLINLHRLQSDIYFFLDFGTQLHLFAIIKNLVVFNSKIILRVLNHNRSLISLRRDERIGSGRASGNTHRNRPLFFIFLSKSKKRHKQTGHNPDALFVEVSWRTDAHNTLNTFQ